jgi:hypothetical protein
MVWAALLYLYTLEKIFEVLHMTYNTFCNLFDGFDAFSFFIRYNTGSCFSVLHVTYRHSYNRKMRNFGNM